MVASTLNVERGQIQSTIAGLTKQKVADVINHLRINFLGILMKETVNELIHHMRIVFENQGSKIRFAEGKRAIHIIRKMDLEIGRKHGVSKAIKGSGEFGRDAWINGGIVSVPSRQGIGIAQNGWKEFIVRDNLHFGTHDFARQIENVVISRDGVDVIFGNDAITETIVLSHKKCVHGDEAQVFIGANVTGQKHL